MRRGENIILKNEKKARKERYNEGLCFTIKNYSAVVLLCLKDKFDFTPDQLQEVSKHINDMFASVCEGYLSLSDVEKVLREEEGIAISFGKEV